MFLLLCITIFILAYSIKQKKQNLMTGAAIAIVYYILSVASDIPSLSRYAFLLSVAENIALLIFVAWMGKSDFKDEVKKDE